MKSSVIAFLVMVGSFGIAVACKAEGPYDYKVIRAVDGDTIEFEIPGLPSELGTKLKLRVLGVDTPEKGFRAQCESEAKKGEEATKFAKEIIASGAKLQITLKEWDKFGGRVLGDILLNGQSLRAMLIQNGYAREYFGDAKQSWC
jgi:endonuclease YncB( thermonuclease family)